MSGKGRQAALKSPSRSAEGNAAPQKPGLAARQVATRLLAAVIDRRVSLDGMLDPSGGNAAYLALGDADRALARAIVTTALRRRAAIGSALASMLERPLPEGARNLRFILEAGAAQVLFLDVPDRAAVDLAVEQANTDSRSRRFAGLVNAVLRRMSREREVLLVESELSGAAPAWFRERLEAAYGPKAQAVLAMLAEPPTIDLTVKGDPEHWAERLGGIVLPTGSVRLVAPEGAVNTLAGYAEGEWWVQDAAAAIPVRLFGDISGQRVADLCAAPGGKTAQLVGAGARQIVALDRSGSRLARLKVNLARLGFEAECIEADLLDYRPAEKFDAVLLDAPCSSTGTIRRHPDVLWTKTPEEVMRLAALQERLLRHALTLVKPGGRLVFSNCSLDPEEGEAVVTRVLTDLTKVRIEPVEPGRLPGLEEAIQSDGTVRTTPTMLPRIPARLGGLDGFYAAVLRVEG